MGKENDDNISMKDFMNEFRTRSDIQRKKLDKNHRKLENLNAKLAKIEEKSVKTGKENKEEFAKIREEITSGMSEMEGKVTENVVNQLKPKIAEIQCQAKEDIAEAVQKEIRSIDIPTLIKDEVKV